MSRPTESAGHADDEVYWAVEKSGPDGVWREVLCGHPSHVLTSFRHWSSARKTRFRVIDEHGEVVEGPSELGGFRDDRQLLRATTLLERLAGVRDSPIGADLPVPRVVAGVIRALRTREGGPTLGELFSIGDPELRRAITSLLAAVDESPAAVDAWLRRWWRE